MSDLMFQPVGELAALVRGGELSARELVQASLDRIEALDPHLNAFVDVDAEAALAAADAIGPDDGRAFAGVPIAIKNNVPVAGLRLTMCSQLLAQKRADHDAHLVRRLRDAGFVIVGTTTLPEFGILPTTESRLTGPTRNPWDPARTPGGSSGGSAAAVAGGLVPAAHGNDGGGSIRIPAACCGLVGLKPSRGRISRGPDLGDSFLTVEGVLTRTVTETAELLDVLAGYEVGDATWAPKPTEPYAVAARRAPGRLRVALDLTPPLIGAALHPEAEAAARAAAELLESLGHEVVERRLPLPEGDLLPLFSAVFAAHVALGVMYGTMVNGREPEAHEIEPLSRALQQQSLQIPSVGYLAAVTRLQAIARDVVAFFRAVDLVLTPALAERPLEIGELDGMGEEPLADFARSGRFTPFTALFNVTGQPAISLPLRQGDDGLPAAVQLVGPPLGEDILLQVAAQVEAAEPWADRRPAALAA